MDFKATVKQLDELADQITAVLIDEANPANWDGAGIPSAYLDKDQRGNRFWDKKNCTATAALLLKVHAIIDAVEDAEKGRKRRDGARVDLADLNEELAQAKREAKKVMERIGKH